MGVWLVWPASRGIQGGVTEQLPKDLSKQAESPWKQSTGVLTWSDCQQQQHRGSGFLISDNLVLTAASNIFNKRYVKQNLDFIFYLKDENTSNRVSHSVLSWQYLPAYSKQYHPDQISQNDYAILKLAYNRSNPIHLKEQLSFSVPCLECIDSRQQILVDICKNSQGQRSLKEVYSGRVTNISHDNFTVRYDIKTDQKDVGSPVVVDSKIFAIHLKSDEKNGGIGRIVTSDMVDTINSFCKKLGQNFIKITKSQMCTCKNKVEEEVIKKDLKAYLLKVKSKKQILMPINLHPAQILKLQTIDLSSYDSQKLTAQSIQAFSQLKLVNLQELKLDNNRISDQGVKLLCKNDYPSLKIIQIDDNGVSINGLQYIYFNKWGEDVVYKLAFVYSNDDGYYLNIGQKIPLIKSLVNQKDMSQNKVINKLCEKTVQNAMKFFLQTPIQGEDLQKMAAESKQLEQRYKQATQQQTLSISTLLLHLKKSLGDNLQFIKEASLKTKVASKIIFNGSSNERVSFEVDLSNFKDISSEQLKDSSQTLRRLEPIFLNIISSIFGVDTADITLDKILNNPPRALASDSLSQILGINLASYRKMEPKFQQYFEKFQLCESEFDSAGDYQFPPYTQAQTHVRGGFPYYQPVIGKRFGIKVMNIFNDNTWLSMDNRKGEYAVGFHGINNPLNSKALQSIMKGRQKGEMLRAGSGQAYCQDDCINKDEKVGNGIYFSPYFLTSLLDYSFISQEQDYHIVLQCRLKPDAIKITHRTDYWVVNKSEDARPYGILLFTREQVQQLIQIVDCAQATSLHKQIYKDQFTQDTWKNTYLSQYKQFNQQ